QSGARIGQIAVPDLVGAFRHLEALDLAPSRRIEQAELEPGGVGGKDGEIGAEAVPGGAQRKRHAGQQSIGPAHHVQPSARSITVESGGKVSRTEWASPCEACSSAWTAPSLPRSLPP